MTDAGWASEKPTEVGWYWYREDGQIAMMTVEVATEFNEPVVIGYRMRANGSVCSKLVKSFTGEWLGPITPTDRAQGRVEGLREAADYVEVQELANPSGMTRKEQLRIYDILIKVEAGIRKLATE